MATHTIDAIIKDLKKMTSQTIREVATDITNNLRIVTPIDTGFARSNWHMSKNSPEPKVLGSKTNVVPIVPMVAGDIDFDISKDKTIYIQNNVQYIQLLNAGWSQQAPAGFVEGVIDEVFLAHRIR